MRARRRDEVMRRRHATARAGDGHGARCTAATLSDGGSNTSFLLMEVRWLIQRGCIVLERAGAWGFVQPCARSGRYAHWVASIIREARRGWGLGQSRGTVVNLAWVAMRGVGSPMYSSDPLGNPRTQSHGVRLVIARQSTANRAQVSKQPQPRRFSRPP